MSKVPRRSVYKKRQPTHPAVSIRMALHKMDFDLALEWIAAFRELTDPLDRIKAAERMAEFLYPKLAPISNEALETAIDKAIELEAETQPVGAESTAKLLESLEDKT